MAKKRVMISVISDLVTDQRVARSAMTMHEEGYEVILIGRKKSDSLNTGERPYQTIRFNLPFERGPMFYASFNIRLFFFLLFRKSDLYISNDLDTLPANFFASRIKNVRLVYDSHEYFTEVPELVNRPGVRRIWTKIEEYIFPKLKRVMTVNESIAGFYRSRYGINVHVVRNLPYRIVESTGKEERSRWNIPDNIRLFLFQGSGINIDRGGEEAIEAIKHVDNAALLFIGGGDVISILLKKVADDRLESKVYFIPKQPMKDLARFTRMADIGLTLDKDTNLNYRYSLPNKLFDYIQAGLPVLATDLIEVKKIVEGYDIGMITTSSDPVSLSEAMKKMLSNENDFARWKKNVNIAAAELCWENEKEKFLNVIKDE